MAANIQTKLNLMATEKQLQNLCPPWKPGQSGNPKGRPKSKTDDILVEIMGKKTLKKLYKMCGEDVDKWELTLMSVNTDMLKLIAKSDHTPTYPKGLAFGIMVDMKNGKTTTLDKIRERQFGKAVQRVELTGKDGESLQPRNLSPDEAKELLKRLESDF